ncbi:permease [Thermorudis peleae]|uniref:permease n=1 Tax=Thermorudis peleae TaxID=1382356 RepID=UPI0005720A97|nr:permease [Thermorudis peleae]
MQDTSTPALSQRQQHVLVGVLIVFVLAVIGLAYVKWLPYYHKAHLAAATGKLGKSILTGGAATPPAPSLHAALDYARTYFLAVWQALVLGLLLAASIQTFLPVDLVTRWIGRACARSTLLGGVFALPGMMCSCCVSPVVVGLRRQGASIGSAVAFFLGNPTLNPAVLVFLVFTLGWQWALLRLVLGILLVFGGAALAERLAGPTLVPQAIANASRPSVAEHGNWLRRWVGNLTRLVVQLLPEYLIVVFLMGLARAWLFPSAGPQLGNSLLVIIALAVVGTLFVIPTAGEIPIIQTMLAFGVGAGPAGALLLTLAPLNLASLLMVSQALPWRVLAALTLLTIGMGILAGLLAIALPLR